MVTLLPGGTCVSSAIDTLGSCKVMEMVSYCLGTAHCTASG